MLTSSKILNEAIINDLITAGITAALTNTPPVIKLLPVAFFVNFLLGNKAENSRMNKPVIVISDHSHSRKAFVAQYAKEGHSVSDFFIHVVCRTGWNYIYEVVSHNIPYEEAREFMKSIREYRFAGWGRVLGLF